MNKTLVSLLCILGSALAQAQIADGGLEVASEHARIASERQQIEKRFADEEAGCFQKFAVNDCRDASRARRRVDMADLRRQEISLNDAERKRKGAEQLQRMEQSAAAKDEPPAAVGTATPRSAAPGPVRARTPTEPRKPYDPTEAAKAQAARKTLAENKARNYQEDQATRARRAAAVAAANEPARYAQKLQEAANHKAETVQRNAAKSKPKAAPLPE
jgi:colicin import membrane protein